MLDLLTLFLNVLAPTFLIAGAGFLLGRRFKVVPRTFAQVIFYVFSPCLIFNLIVENQLGSADILRMMAFSAAVAVPVGLSAWLAGRALRLERRLLAAVMLTAIFMNAGNLGLPVTGFAFGETAMAHASLYFIAMSLLTNTAGIVIASLGHTSLRAALLGLLKVPTIYALGLALLVGGLNWQIPLPLERTTQLLGDGAIPSMLLLLGLQFNHARWTGQKGALAVTAGSRLLVGPLAAFALSAVFGLQGAARQAGILESAMPSAVLTTVLASEYDAEPAFVSVAVFVTTLLSPLTLTPILAFLGA